MVGLGDTAVFTAGPWDNLALSRRTGKMATVRSVMEPGDPEDYALAGVSFEDGFEAVVFLDQLGVPTPAPKQPDTCPECGAKRCPMWTAKEAQ